MTKAVTVRQFQRTLEEFGFEKRPVDGREVYVHAATGAAVSVPTVFETVRPVYVSAAAQAVAYDSIATRAAFEAQCG